MSLQNRNLPQSKRRLKSKKLMHGPLTVLGIESSCDETAVAILRSENEFDAPEILSSVISSQIAIHREHGGVVPELASRNHSVDLPRVIREACNLAGIKPIDIDVFGATAGPGLVAALLVGNSTAKALALATGRPFVSVNHLEGHLLSPFVRRQGGPIPHLGMVVSGGHTLFVDVRGVGDYRLLGRSLDDAAGEAFDKVGKMLGLPYPGGPEIDKLAAKGNPQAFDFPRALMKEASANVSFSGLKTAVLYTLPKLSASGNPADLPEQTLFDLCASFQRAVVDVLVKKALFALRVSGHDTISVSGGVSCNAELRCALSTACKNEGVNLILPDFDLTTDNAAMIAYVTMLKSRQNLFHSLSDDVDPNLKLTTELNRAKTSTHS